MVEGGIDPPRERLETGGVVRRLPSVGVAREHLVE
jgi:hypothetical protein